MAEYEVTGSAQHGRAVITLTGDLALDTVQQVEQDMRDARRRHGEHLVLDLRGLRFLDSTGLSLLLRFYLAAEGRGGSAVLAGPIQDEVLRVLQVTHVDERLTIRPNLDTALADPLPTGDPT
ncbi:STAS domain-containing protein [Actinomadura fibrosa]|uniref:Anti-sigma factor antagonist n=1 Tax=Actinomadura fibrosa TaxID=111802 RepID=A0ABW2XMP4_9ACTN|nr:STAS domain-containing protein [Actinomadura fibrosa]